MTQAQPDPFQDELLAHRGWVSRLCRHLVQSPADADELEQEAWRRALESPPRHNRNLRAWLSAVVRSAANQRLRGESRLTRARAKLTLAAGESAEATGDPSELAARRETFRVLHELVDQLEAPYGEVVFLRYVEGLPPRVIARRLELPIPLVKSRLQTGIGRLRGRLSKRLGSDWQARCLVFLPSLPTVAVSKISTAVLMTKSSKLALAAAAAILVLPIATVAYLQTEANRSDKVEANAVDPAAAERSAVSRVEPSIRRDELASASRQEVAAAEPVEGDGPEVRIRVRDAETRQAIANAEVFVLDYAHPDFEQERYSAGMRERLYFPQEEAVLREFGQVVMTGIDGVIDLPRPFGRFLEVGASTDSSFMSANVQCGEEGVEKIEVDLLMRPRADVSFKVVDHLGNAVPRMRVALASRTDDRPWSASSVQFAVTDEVGEGVLRNTQIHAPIWMRGGAETALVAHAATTHPVALPCDPLANSKQPITLQLPATVRLVVGVPERLEEWFSNGWTTGLCPESHPDRPDSFIDRLTNWSAIARSEYVDGRVVFPHVEPGFTGSLTVQLPWLENIHGVVQRIEIPHDARGDVHVEVEVPDSHDGIEFRFLASDGEALDQEQFQVSAFPVRSGGPRLHAFKIYPQEPHSRFFAEDANWVRESPQGRRYLVNSWSLPDPDDKSRAHHFTSFEFDAGAIDTDPRVLPVQTSNELILSGRVVDQEGNPLANIRVGLDGPGRVVPEANRGWFEGLHVWTGPEGTFEVRGHRGVLKELTLIRPGHAMAEFEFTEGERGRDFVLPLPPSLVGEVLTDAGISTELLSARALSLQGGRDPFGLQIAIGTGRLQPSTIRDGLSEEELAVAIFDSFHEEVFRSRPIRMLGRGEIRPDDLNPIDLRGLLTLWELEVFSSAGESIPGCTVTLAGTSESTLLGPRSQLVTGRKQLEVFVDADGYLVEGPIQLTGRDRIQLESGHAVTLVLPEEIDLSSEHVDYVLRAVSSSTQPGVPELVREVFLRKSETTLVLPRSGSWKLSLSSQRRYPGEDRIRSSNRRTPLTLQGSEWVSIEVEAESQATQVQLPVTEQDLNQPER